jgi:hypothetical protein
MENQPQENSEVRETVSGAPNASQDVGEDGTNETQPTPWIKFREILHESLEKARKTQQPVSTHRELGKDKTKSLFVLVGAVVLILLIFLGVFSSPQKAKKLGSARRPGTPDLGRKVTPGQENAQRRSVTPMLNAEVGAGQTLNNSDVTPEDVGRTARLGLGEGHAAATPAAPPSQGLRQNKNPGQYALNKIDFDSALAQQPGYGVGPADQQPPVPRPATQSTESDELRKPSLVFVRAVQSGPAAAPTVRMVAQEQGAVLDALSPGTRLVARLESAVSTAVKEPVVAVIEYNYERDGEIVVPAGAKAVGQLRQADRSGYVDIKFDMLEMPDGTTEKMDGVAMDLKFGPLKGYVAGKRTGTKFLVRSLTGVGTVAAYLVGGGAGTGFNGPLSESALLRERIANNVGIAGDQELSDLAFTQNIVVTLPGNTRFYIVLESVSTGRSVGTQPATLASAGSKGTSLPSLDELRQLMQLKQELSTMYQQGSMPSTAAQAPQQ